MRAAAAAGREHAWLVSRLSSLVSRETRGRQVSSSRLLAALTALAVVTLSPALLATTYCEDIEGNLIIVGETRYKVLSGSSNDEVYANSYWDTGAELSLDEFIGGASSSATDLRFYAYAYQKDDTNSDCSDTTFELDLEWSNTQSGGCPSSPGAQSETMVITGCDTGVNLVWAGKRFGLQGLSFRKYWRATVSADSAEVALTDDDACFHVKDQAECTLVDF